MRVVHAIAQWFEVAGFKHYFGYAGGAVWPFLDALTDKPRVEGIQAKQQSHAVHMADIYQRVSYRAEWEDEIRPLQTASTAPTHPARLVHAVGRALPKDGRGFIDIGDVTQYAEAYMKITAPGAWQISPGMAEMGWASSGIPGALVADGRPAIALVGDGAFNMTSQVDATAVEYDLPVIWVVLNNYELGIERKGMERSHSRSHPWCHFRRKDTGERYNPDYVALAHAYGAEGLRIEDPAALAPALTNALASRWPWVIDVPIDRSVGSYFTKGIDRACPDKWAKSYASYNLLRNAET